MKQNLKILKTYLPMLLAFLISAVCLYSPVRADISPSGDVSPALPWTSSDTGYVGNTLLGSLVVNLDSTLLSSSCNIGYQSGVLGDVTINDSTWTNSSNLRIGYYGIGELSIVNGGFVSTRRGYVGYQAGSTGTLTVDGSDSSLTSSSSFFVGSSGNGTLLIQNSGNVTSSAGYIAYQTTSSGEATVDGAGSTWTNTSDLHIGNKGAGTLNISNGGAVVTNTIKSSSGTMNVNFDGGVLKPYDAANPNWIAIGAGGGNVYLKEGGAKIDTAGYNMGIGAALQHGETAPTDGGLTKTGTGALTLSSANTYTGQTVVQQGSLVLGLNAHNPVFNNGGADVQAAGRLAFDYIGGSTPIATVRDSLFSGKIFSSDATASHGLGYAENGSSQVRVEYAYYGDSDLDGDVDNSDFLSVYGSYTGSGGGTTEVWASGDFDYDGDVDNSDFLSVYGNYTGSTAGTQLSLLLSSNPGIANLIYDPTTGNVKLDATQASGEVITGFVLQNAVGGDDFITGVVDFPYLVGSEEDLLTEISDIDLTKVGFSGVWDLGNIFVPGLDEASLSAWLTKANYVGAYGSGEFRFDLTVVPEPSTLALLACGLFGLAAYAWRKRK